MCGAMSFHGSSSAQVGEPGRILSSLRNRPLADTHAYGMTLYVPAANHKVGERPCGIPFMSGHDVYIKTFSSIRLAGRKLQRIRHIDRDSLERCRYQTTTHQLAGDAIQVPACRFPHHRFPWPPPAKVEATRRPRLPSYAQICCRSR